MNLVEILRALGATGALVEVEALQSEDPLQVVALQPWEILGLQGY